MAEQEQGLTFMEHLEEMRGLLVRSCLALVIACCLVGGFFPYVADFLNYPLNAALGEDKSALQGLVTTSPMGIFSVLIQVCFLGGLALALPFILYWMAQFIAPGLTEREKRLLIPCCIAVFGLFGMGAAFSYFFVIPTSLEVSISLNKTFGFELIWSAPQYYGLVVWMTLGIGLCFEFPLAILVLIHLGVVSVAKLKTLRRHMVMAILVSSALITPGGDPLSLVIIALPLYALFEGALLVGSKIEKKAEIEAQKEETPEEVPWPLN